MQAVVDAAIANVAPTTVTISFRGDGADSELVYVEGGMSNAIGIRLVPAPTEEAATGRFVLAAVKVGQALKYGWYNIQAAIQSARLAVKAELTGQINLLSEAINSLGRVQQWSAVLTELARGMFTAAAGATWKQNIEGQRTYPATLDWLWVKWGQEYRGSGKNYVTGGNTNDIQVPGRWNLNTPSVAFSRHVVDPAAAGNPWPGMETFYTGMAFYASGPNIADALDNGNLIVAGAYKRKPFELPENDNLRHKILWLQNAAGVVKEIMSIENQRLIVRHANPHGATEGRTYTRYYGLTTTNNEGLPPFVNDTTVNFQLPDNIADGQKVRVTVHAVVEGSELPPVTKEYTIAAVARNQVLNGNETFVFDGIANPTASVDYVAATNEFGLGHYPTHPPTPTSTLPLRCNGRKLSTTSSPPPFPNFNCWAGGRTTATGFLWKEWTAPCGPAARTILW